MSLKLQNEEDIKLFIENNSEMMRILKIVSDLNLPDWTIGGGWLRNKIWDKLSGLPEDKQNDIDICYYDSNNIDPETDWKIDNELKEKYPDLKLEARNQARMHYYNNFDQFTCTEDSMAHWPETATCIGVKLVDGQVALRFIYGTEDLLNLIARPCKYFKGDRIDVFRHRVTTKGWQERWPKIVITEE